MQLFLRFFLFFGLCTFLCGKGRGEAPLAPAKTPASGVSSSLEFQVEAPQAILYDMLTETVLFEKDADQIMPPSSMTKMLLIYLLFEKLSKGEISLSDTFTVSEKAWRMGGSKMFVPLGEKVSLSDLLQGIIVQSGNDACVVVTEGLAGSEETFVSLMNEKAKELGASKTHFLNSTGWPERGHTSTPRDLMLFGIRTIQDFPEFYKTYYGQKEFRYNGIRQMNRNPLLYTQMGDGLKTGHTDDGGFGLTGSGIRGERRLIFVINGLKNDKKRSETAEKILQYGLDGFEVVTLYTKDAVVEKMPLSGASQPSFPLVTDKPIIVSVKRGYKDKLKTRLIKKVGASKLPIEKGKVLADLVVSSPGLPDKVFPLTAGTSVQKQAFFMHLWNSLKGFLFSWTN